MAENELPKKAIPDVAKYRKSDVIFANGMSRNRVMEDPELRKLYEEDVIEKIEAETKKSTGQKMRDLLEKRRKNGRKI